MERRITLKWIPIAVTVTIIYGVFYGTWQQMLRQGANSPQLQVAEDTAHAIESGKDPSTFVVGDTIKMEESLSQFIIVYDDEGRVIASSGSLHGKTPVPPSGVFTYTRDNIEDRLTWEPEAGARFAAVLRRYEGKNPGFVLVARSLRETEKRIAALSGLLFFAWIFTLFASYLSIRIARKSNRYRSVIED